MQDQRAFTLIELLIVLLLIAIMLAWVVPVSHTLLKRHHLSVQTRQLLTAIALARSEAIKRSMPVTLCKSADGLTCSGEWSSGSLLFVDVNRNGQVQDKKNIIRVFKASYPDIQIIWRGFLSNDYVTMSPSGLGHAMNGHFTMCSLQLSDTRTVIVNRVGRARVETSDVFEECSK